MIIGAPTSGAGKTTATLALLRALKNRGLKIGSAKVGPDYIDPAFHSMATGRPCLNLDSWAMRFETLAGLLHDAARGCDLLVIEGVMGLFDGAPDGSGSTADLAALFDLPVTLVVDGQRMGASAAALIEGFLRFREDVEVTTIIFNSVGSATHKQILHEACDDRFSTPILGYLPREQSLNVPSRHLGLVQAKEHRDLEAFIERAAAIAEDALDLDRLIRLCRTPSVEALGLRAKPMAPLGQKIAVAKDVAFGFAYQATINGWHRAGAEISFFSPLGDEAPHKDSDAVFLPGGYPELHAERLAKAAKFKAGLQRQAEAGATIYGECGGYMVLGRSLTDKDGKSHAMAGLLPVETSFAQPKRHLGYRHVELANDCPLGRPGQQFRGHEFHYAAELRNEGQPLFAQQNARKHKLGPSGSIHGRVCGSFTHIIDRFTHLRLVD